jgi:RNA polymerase-binding transcription factor DksA
MTDTTTRHAGLRQMLSERRREMQDDADTQGDIELALLQMRAEMLTRIDAALVRLDAGKYGFCSECEGEISERRLRALPFAVRCQPCEERREQEQGRARQFSQPRGSLSLFSDVIRPAP